MLKYRLPFGQQFLAWMSLISIFAPGLVASAETGVTIGKYLQEVACHREMQSGLPALDITAIERTTEGLVVRTSAGAAQWDGQKWVMCSARDSSVEFPSDHGELRQLSTDGVKRSAAASSEGLFERIHGQTWKLLHVDDGLGRRWATQDVRGVAYDADGGLWFATMAGVGRRDADGNWDFYEGKDGLPYNDFTCCATGMDGSVWFGTRKGAIRYQDGMWAYRQGLRWLPNDDVRAMVVDDDGTAWFATASGVGCIRRRMMTLDEKAQHYEEIIEKFVKRTSYGYTDTPSFGQPGVMERPRRHDSDNDGLWTAMYGVSQCFAYAVTGSENYRQTARKSFEALRFLQTVTQGGEHAPPLGYVARTILSTSGRDPNQGRLALDEQMKATRDRLWKIYEPRWPVSADGKWYWKSDTSSDELDGHYFLYAQYYDLVAKSEVEKEEVRLVVRRLTDHLIEHDYTLTDHDGRPTRWANFRPSSINYDYDWMTERGLNSLSVLSYLVTAHHITGDDKYWQAFLRLMRQHSYHTNAMVPKMQRGIGSGNQSDDEMAFMSFYNLLKYLPETVEGVPVRQQFLAAFYWYWTVEQPERNPFFHFSYAVYGLGQSIRDPFGEQSLSPWGGWLEDSVDALKDFPLDRFDWSHENSHRIDLIHLPTQQGPGTLDNNVGTARGMRVDGKVLPVSERHFAHWNTDPWRYDTGGQGHNLANGTVFLLPYYMGRYHGFVMDQ
ncbi:MAG: hypothetical protein CMJ80_12325 [Planctomycetaceae bacterium]|nr:hypothetical protein [Planctomycetaceae bacterium]